MQEEVKEVAGNKRSRRSGRPDEGPSICPTGNCLARVLAANKPRSFKLVCPLPTMYTPCTKVKHLATSSLRVCRRGMAHPGARLRHSPLARQGPSRSSRETFPACAPGARAAFWLPHTSSTPLMQPSFSGLLVTCAYLPHTTLPPGVTSPSSDTLTSMMVPLVMTPSVEYIVPLGFFFTPMMSRQKVAFSSGCVTCALVIRRPVGLMKRSYFGAFRVKPGPTNVTFVIMRFQLFFMRLPDLSTLNISSSATGRTFGSGTSHLPAFSFRFCLIVLLSTLALSTCSLSSRYAGTAFCGAPSSALCFLSFSSCIAIVFFISAFS
mmetsp:Transcript_25737/g.76163  ORF Transcript_25737/g.76163 Transcript_25737/m.76163 type:complete len:321 (-) Transcript_25737:215-1177(-)